MLQLLLALGLCTPAFVATPRRGARGPGFDGRVRSWLAADRAATIPLTTRADMQIRPYLEQDEDAVVALWHICELTRPWNDPRKDIARKLTVQRDLFLVGETEGRIVATVMAGYEGHRGWVNYLAVSPDMRGRGCGARLMARVEERFIAAGCPKVSLLVRTTNASMLAFYRHLGYVVDDAVPLGKRLIVDE